MTGRVTFKEDWCKGCGLCITACPKGIIALDQERSNRKGYFPAGVKEMHLCIGCGNCARFCPDSIITVERFKEGEKND